MLPFCFVLMPFGQKCLDGGRTIDFDLIYNSMIEPAVRKAKMEPIRADREAFGGIIHKAMFERLMLCEYAVADLTTANPNVFYELGIRHGVRPHSTLLIAAKGTPLPCDVAPMRVLPYLLHADGSPAQTDGDIQQICLSLEACRHSQVDSPPFQLLVDWPVPNIARLKTDRFRELVAHCQGVQKKLAEARNMDVKSGAAALALAQVEAELAKDAKLEDTDPTILVDLLLSYRAVNAFDAMVALGKKMPQMVAGTVLVREQLAFALNRVGRDGEAESILKDVISQHGPSSETNGLLGRVYKDRWQRALKANNPHLARGQLRMAIETYLAGFEADWRDAYPGINAVTLMEMTDPVDPRQKALMPVVHYAVARRLAHKSPDYWDHATLLEHSVLEGDPTSAMNALADAMASVREIWEPQTTANNLRMIAEARRDRGLDVAWIVTMIDTLNNWTKP